ncbi:MAG: low temperature requirement protein A [Dysgonomonas sp.]|nr:low temperature requirement protein A [Dysgonomonas sp.]
MKERQSHRLLRKREEEVASVSFSELLFDLIYVFAVTQLSHYLLHHLDLRGFIEATILWFGIWMVWQHTVWVTNWFDPNTRSIRLMLFSLMIISLFMTASIPEAFDDRGLVFAVCYVTMQVGRSLCVVLLLGNNHQLSNNYKRILAWMCISGIFWIAGAFAEDTHRMILWGIAVLTDYTSPMFGFYFPGLGRSDSAKEWTIEGHHILERCQLFVIIAFGETILMTGASLSEMEDWTTEKIIAALVSFLGSLVMWWVYFDTSSEVASRRIRKVSNPGLLGLRYHAIHVILVGALIVCAVGDEMVVNHPSALTTTTSSFILIAGPIIYIITNMIFKWMTCRMLSISHSIAIVLLLLLIPASFHINVLVINTIVVFVFIFIILYDLFYPQKSSLAEANKE